MFYEQLSILNLNYYYGCHPLNLRSFLKCDPYYEDFNSKFPINISKPKIKDQEPTNRRRVLDKILKKISEKDLPGKAYFQQYMRHKYRRNCKSKTLLSSFTALGLFLSFYKNTGKDYLEQVTREDIESFIEHEQDRGLKPASVRTRLCALYAFISFLIEDKAVGHELLERKLKVKLPDMLPRAINPDEIKLLLSVIDHTRNRAMILVLLRTGMRIGELLNTKVIDLDLREQKVMIYQAHKTDVGRVVYYSDDAQEALVAWLKERDPFKDRLFYGQGRDSLSYEAARTMFNKYLGKAALLYKGYTLHCLRHTFASELLNAGMRLECLQVLMGHTSVEVTRRYARLTDRTREEEYFKAMTIIQRGEIDGHYQLDH